jgi:GrpB-like predicted nucleotidyltransferase (UPF0157 family)
MLQLHHYDPSYNDIFKRESEKIAKLLVGDYLIEHIGSTAIPGTDGKGVVDIIVAFNSIEEMLSAIIILEKHYHFIDDKVDRDTRIFMTSSEKDSGEGDIHLHLVLKDSDDYNDAILFRDYLIKHQDAKQAYVNLKYDIQKNITNDRAEYTKHKADFIHNIIALAKTNSHYGAKH